MRWLDEWVPRPDGSDDPFLKQVLKPDGGPEVEVAADAEIHGAVVEEITKVEWDVDEPNPHTGCLIRQPGDQRSAEEEREVVRRGDDEVAVCRGRIECVGLKQQIDVGADPVDVCSQLLGAWSQPHPTSDAHEDRVVERVAEPGQCAADRWLRQVHVVRQRPPRFPNAVAPEERGSD